MGEWSRRSGLSRRSRRSGLSGRSGQGKQGEQGKQGKENKSKIYNFLIEKVKRKKLKGKMSKKKYPNRRHLSNKKR